MDADRQPLSIESRGSTVDAAIEVGLAKLRLARHEVEIEILDEGSRGILGIGSRDAVVRLTQRVATPPVATPRATTPRATTQPAPPASPAPVETTPPVTPASPTVPAAEEKEAPAVEPQLDESLPFPQSAALQEEEVTAERTGMAEETAAEDEEDSDAYLEQEREAAIAILTELLDKMRVRATVTAAVSESDEVTGRRVNMLSVTGEDLGVLIGPRGDTLDALQYISRLMVAHRLHRRAHFLVDVEGYRERREQALVRLAERMADKARQRQEPITLEPMPPYERRIIHMTLRNAEGVYTESTGEGDRRKVRIYPQ